ncbi:hypothetical protein [Candidatus Weimeria sp. HCP3S3_B5]|uniref:hypothetical protein n=1 Tax=Candidatus Weimeria sp. HCP3S3_B5 TaxID=3438871 RepID=UPI003F8A765F
MEKPNYMNLPASIRELEKIEMIRQADGMYRLDHAVTATQKYRLSSKTDPLLCIHFFIANYRDLSLMTLPVSEPIPFLKPQHQI